MAEFYVVNSLNNKKAVKFNITLRYVVPTNTEGDHKWILEIGTTEPDKNGNKISAKKIYLTNLDNIDEVIESNVNELCKLINWEPFVADKKAPFINYYSPHDGSINVPIFSIIEVIIKDSLPSAGIDLSNMKVIFDNGMQKFDITSAIEIEGDAYEYKLKWAPTRVVYSTYD